MAIKADFSHGDIFAPGAYYRIVKLVLAVTDVEEVVDKDRGFSQIEFKKEFECIAHIFVYADNVARSNCVSPIGHFAIEFNYPNTSDANPYVVAYDALKNTKRIQEVIYENC